MPAIRTFDREKVSAIIMESIDLGLPLIPTVVSVMNVTINQARHMVRAVREDGHLGATPHHPARATIHRGSGAQRSWLVCEVCMIPWPCELAFPYGTHLKNLRGLEADEPGPRRAPRRSPARRSRTQRRGDETTQTGKQT
jgi:hypothetical protein